MFSDSEQSCRKSRSPRPLQTTETSEDDAAAIRTETFAADRSVRGTIFTKTNIRSKMINEHEEMFKSGLRSLATYNGRTAL